MTLQKIALTVTKVLESLDAYKSGCSNGERDLPRALRAAGFKGTVYGGAYRKAFISAADKFVVKFTKNDEAGREKALFREYMIISHYRKTCNKKHFPETYFVSVNGWDVLVQELIFTQWAGTPKADWQFAAAVEQHAARLHIADMHADNWGWRIGKNGKREYVFIDVDLVWDEIYDLIPNLEYVSSGDSSYFGPYGTPGYNY